jgi:hypothetical protein
MNPLDDYATSTTKKASFNIGLDTNTWDFIHKASPTLSIAFELFPDLEAIDIDFMKLSRRANIAYLSRVPRAWMRINGEVDVYVPDDDPYGISGYLLDVGEQISPLPLSLLPSFGDLPHSKQRFNMTFTPSACLIRDAEKLDGASVEWDNELGQDMLTIEGFTSRSNPGGSKSHRLSAQMTTVCELLSKEMDVRVELDKIYGSHSKS